MKRLKMAGCYGRAALTLARRGIWVPHVYEDVSEEAAVIIATDRGFRVSRDYVHAPGETVYPEATLIRSKCIYCGKEELSWRASPPIKPVVQHRKE